MSNERQSKDNRVIKFARDVKKKFVPLFQLSRPVIPASIDVDPKSDNQIAAIDSINRAADKTVASTETDSMSAPVSIPVSTSRPDVPIQLGSLGSSKPENQATHIFPANTRSPMSLFQGAQHVYMAQPTITMANTVRYMSNADGDENSKGRILNTLSEKLLPRAQFAEYDAASPAPRNGCTKGTRKTILDTLQVWANDKTTTKVYWLNGMAGTGKTTIAYSFSEILREKGSLGGTFFSSRLWVDTSDVRCIIPTISLQLAKYLPSLSHLILDVVQGNPDCSSWRIGKQFLNFIVRPLTAAYRDTREVVVVPVIVLDALDECSDHSFVAELVSVILKHISSSEVLHHQSSRNDA